MDPGQGRSALALAQRTLEVVAGRWMLDVADQLSRTSPMRYSDLVDAIPDIPEGSLSRTLRQMERDGLVRRIMRPTMPVQVDYQLTDLGASIIELLDVLAGWAVEHGGEVERARLNYRDPQG